MARELSYILVTPHALRKARLGGIVSRLLSRTGLDLVRARLLAPGDEPELVNRYAATAEEPLYDYLVTSLPGAIAALLVVEGENAVVKVARIVGDFGQRGTLRDTYGEQVFTPTGELAFYDPAVIAPANAAAAERELLLWADHTGPAFSAQEDPASPEGSSPETAETTLVLIKPDNFRFPNYRPGNIIDLFSAAGLDLVGLKVHHMSVAEASEFYGPVLEVLKAIMGAQAGAVAREALVRELGLPIPEEVEEQLSALLGPIHAQNRWETLIAFMAGARPSETPEAQRHLPGTEKVLALVYQGEEAVRKIRELLGSTNPETAALGTVRKEFGESMMINAAHASDSAANAQREMAILNLAENNLKPFVESFFKPAYSSTSA